MGRLIFATKASILLILLNYLVIPGSYKQLSLKLIPPALKSKYNQRPDKGPVYHPLRERPFTRKTFKA